MIHSQKRHVAILVADGFEQSHMIRARDVLEESGIITYLVCTDPLLVISWSDGDYSESHVVDKVLDDVSANDFDSLLIPGGLLGVDILRQDPKAIAFVRQFSADGKPIAAIGHGVQVLNDAGCLHNRAVTSAPSIRRDLDNAGANWKNVPFIVDANLLTAQSTENIASYQSRFIQHFYKGSRAGKESIAA